jgi:iron-sulfur cluster assembly protein
VGLRREENVLIRVTEEAKALLSTVDMGTLDSAEGTVLRLDPVAYDKETGEMSLSFAPGEGKGNDQIIQHGGEQVLRIAGAVSQRLNGSTMDVVVEEGPEGTSMGIGIMPPGPDPFTDDS